MPRNFRPGFASFIYFQALDEVPVSAEQEYLKPNTAKPTATPTTPTRALQQRKSVWGGVVQLLDLQLLRTPAFVNLVMGASLGLFADVTFLQFLPFILGDRGFSTQVCRSS